MRHIMLKSTLRGVLPQTQADPETAMQHCNIVSVSIRELSFFTGSDQNFFGVVKGGKQFLVGAQFMPGLLDVNLCKNKQTNNNITMLLYL